jgi:hypothetical protein
MLLLSAVLAISQVIHLYVSPQGDDSSRGSLDSPVRSLEGARVAARQHPHRKIVVEFQAGVYRLGAPVRFSAEDSGDISYVASHGNEVTFSGSQAFRPNWSHYTDSILKCVVPEGFDADQLFLNGDRQTLARYPNEDLSVRILHGYAKDAISADRVKTWHDPSGGFLHAMHAEMWGDFHYRIIGKDDKGGVKLEGGWQNNRKMGMHDTYRFVEGIFEELDAPGEWFLDRKARTLYLYPRRGVDVSNCQLEGPHLSSLIEVTGTKGLAFRGFHFQHTTRTFMENREPLLRSDWTIFRGGALYFNGASNCVIEDCVLDNLGGNAVFVDGKNRKVSIRRCRIENVGANGVAFVGSPKAVRSPLFEYNERQSYEKMDKSPGPKTDDYPADCLVEDCLIDRTGTVEKQTAGVQIAMSAGITVRHCSIYHVPRAGINIGDGCWGGHVIEGCDVFDTVLETGDHGSFNSWGRDRYWGLTDVDMNLGKRPELADLDAVKPIIIQNNRWRCDHGWDIDLDDGSSRYIIRNNLCLHGGIKNREGFGRVVTNNVIVGNSFHPHVWFLNSGDVFANNIVFTPYQPIQVHKPWGSKVDFNFLYVPGALSPRPASELAQQSGRDEHSIAVDALFVDSTKGNFTVKINSPALALGFVNFAMDDFGVRTPALRALARQPVMFDREPHANLLVPTGSWLGATVKDLIDPNDLSATGSGERHGVLVSAVPNGSEAEKIGLSPLDVIRSINGNEVHAILDLDRFVATAGIRLLKVWREQKEFELQVDKL